jgi:hypothetical protein
VSIAFPVALSLEKRAPKQVQIIEAPTAPNPPDQQVSDLSRENLLLPNPLPTTQNAAPKGGAFGSTSSAGGGTRTPDTRIMMGDRQGSKGSSEGSQARKGHLSSAESRELGARLGARRKRKKRRSQG